MDPSIETRFNRSLMVHGLQNLVFEKRQRKPATPAANPIFVKNTENHKKTETKKIEAKVNKPPVKLDNKKQNIKKQSEKVSKKVSAISYKKKTGKRKQQNSDSQSSSEQKDQSLEILPKKNIKIISHAKERKNNESSEQKVVSKQDLDDNTMKGRGRGRPRKIVEDTNEKLISQPQQKPNLDEHKQIVMRHEPAHIQNSIPKSDIVSKTLISKVDQPTQNQLFNQQLMQATRFRAAKMSNLKNYNENQDVEEQYESESDIPYKKKKKISKSRLRARNNKPYSLNRIFRKEVKRAFPSFTLNVNLNKLSFSSFINEFGVFDLINFSLPISYLHLFPQITNLMQKGFIFVWVEQKQTQIGYHLLNRWGFDIIDQIVWIKANEEQNIIETDQNDPVNRITDESEETQKNNKQKNLFINMKSTCLVGYKCPAGNKAEYRTKVSNNIIFAKSMKGLRKPAQIYQIADLMMPGAKKLQIGGTSQAGWLNLEHHERTLYRCNVCLRQQDLYFLKDCLQPVKCKKCIVNQLSEQSDHLLDHYRKLQKIPITYLTHFPENAKGTCSKCNRHEQELPFQGFIMVQDDPLCKDCFIQYSTALAHPLSQITIISSKKNYYHHNQYVCSNCNILSLYDVFFECTKCKAHAICKACFWKLQQTPKRQEQPSGQQQIKKSLKKQTIHEWKLKFVKTQPLMKFSCFGCKIDLTIPFWCCQTCQNWVWCGKCDKGHSEIHPHYQNGHHNEYLMI